jgi:hypothetical protein
VLIKTGDAPTGKMANGEEEELREKKKEEKPR